MRTGTEIRRSRARLSEQRKKTGNYEQNDRLKWYYHNRKLIMLSYFIILCKTSRKMLMRKRGTRRSGHGLAAVSQVDKRSPKKLLVLLLLGYVQ
jgi:hypothetical protein